MECSKCGAPAELAKLFDVISGEGIIKVCQRCMSYDNAPIIKRPTEEQIKNIDKSESVYKRLSNAAGLDPKEHKANLNLIKKEEVVKKQEVTLRDLVEDKFEFTKKEDKKKREDLIENFHWIIMRARRSKKLSISQLAREIGESERSIKLAEQGVLPEDNYNLVVKLEEVLGIRILNHEIAEQLANAKKQLGFDKFTTKTITIADLQKMKEESVEVIEIEEEEVKVPYWKRFVNKLIKKKNVPENPIVVIEKEKESIEEMEFEKPKETAVEFDNTSLEISEEMSKEEHEKTEELTQKDIDDIIFGRS